MIKTPFILAVAVLFSFASSAIYAEEFSSLEERMTGREFRDAGLHKLTEEELSVLNRWIEVRSLADGELPSWATDANSGTAPAVVVGEAASDNRGLEDGRREEISSRLIGSFSGWRGDNVFELENGMVWEQTENRTFSVPTMENPQVRIIPGMLGSWYLQVEGYNSRTRVQRVR
jgi:hypothetical protein